MIDETAFSLAKVYDISKRPCLDSLKISGFGCALFRALNKITRRLI